MHYYLITFTHTWVDAGAIGLALGVSADDAVRKLRAEFPGLAGFSIGAYCHASRASAEIWCRQIQHLHISPALRHSLSQPQPALAAA